MRIVSLLASGTEIVCALGAGDWLVGRSHECDNPDWVRSLPPCSEPAFDVSVSSSEINAEVNRRIRAGEPLYRIDAERIRDLAPDLVITQAHCDVCAVTPGDVQRSGCAAPHILSLAAGTLEGIFSDIRKTAIAIGLPDRGEELVATLHKQLSAVRLAAAGHTKPSVVVLEWTDPVFAMGNWGPELVDSANGELLIGSAGQYSNQIPFEQVRAADPEFLIVAPCGFGLDRALRERSVLESYAGWQDLRAVRNRTIAVADGNLYFNRSGTTVASTAEILAEILHGIPLHTCANERAWSWMYR